MPEPGKHCLVGYKSLSHEGGYLHGYAFDKLTACCAPFQRFFEASDIFNASPGINLLQRGGELNVYLRCGSREEKIGFCPFCGAPITVKETAAVTLREKFRRESDGYEEVRRKEFA